MDRFLPASQLISFLSLPAPVHPLFRHHYVRASSRSRSKWGAHSNPAAEQQESIIISVHHSSRLCKDLRWIQMWLSYHPFYGVMMAFSATGNSNPSIGYSVFLYSERASCDLDFWFYFFIYIFTYQLKRVFPILAFIFIFPFNAS